MRTWIKPGGQQIKLNTRPETEEQARRMGFVPLDRRSERPDIGIRIERTSTARMEEIARMAEIDRKLGRG